MKKGFTLIELLMVIAIIGILSSIVIISLKKGVTPEAKKVKIETEMQQIKPIAAAIYSDTGSYENLCVYNDELETYVLNTEGTGYDKQLSTIKKSVEDSLIIGGCSKSEKNIIYCVSETEAYCLFAYSKIVADYWEIHCIDSTGLSTTTVQAYYCGPDDATPYTCSP